MYLYNTLSRKKEIFKPLKNKAVSLYSCGPTVYNYAHIGNLRTYIFVDTLKRALEANGYKVKHIMNITDVGHLTSDEDSGEDKLEKGATREEKSVWEVAEFYTNAFKNDLQKLNIIPPNFWSKATDHIQDQIKLIKILEKKGFIYENEKAVYFNTSKIKKYGELAGKIRNTKVGAGKRKGAPVEIDQDKKNENDFVLWFKLVGKYKDHIMRWPSPWGDGFPGWHIECSAMSMKYLGNTIDIHTGGIDHIGVHHTNEIAQSESATGKKFVKYWLHGGFLTVDGEGKMAKSGENFITLEKLIEKRFYPLSFRYLALNALYGKGLEFKEENLEGIEKSLFNLYQIAASFYPLKQKTPSKNEEETFKKYRKEFMEAINDNLNTPKAISIIWKIIRSDISHSLKVKFLCESDPILGLEFNQVKNKEISSKIKDFTSEREICRSNKQFMQADVLRNKIKELGYEVEDTAYGPCLKPISNYLPKI